MALRCCAGKKGFNPDARAVPAKAQLFQAAAVLACVALSAYVGIGCGRHALPQ